MNTQQATIGVGLALMIVALALTGCEEATQSSLDNEEAKTASVTLGVSLWDQDRATKALIDDTRTQSIQLEWWTVAESSLGWRECVSYIRQRQGTATLTPDNPTHTVNLVPGQYCFGATAFSGPDGGGAILEQVWTGGTLTAGSNTVILTFLSGVWTFVSGPNNTPTPIELSYGGTTLAGFSLAPFSLVPSAAKAAIDLGKPVGAGNYFFDWGVDADMSDPSKVSEFYVVSQFGGGSANESGAVGGFYNLTQDCSDAFIYFDGSSCPLNTGDTQVLLLGLRDFLFDDIERPLQPFPLPAASFNPDVSQYITTTVVDGNTISGNLVEMLLQSESVQLVQVGTAAASSAATSAGAAKTAQSPNSYLQGLTVTNYDYAVCGTDSNGDQSIDVGDWVFDPTDKILEEGGWVCYEYGYVTSGTPDFGEYSWGVEQTGSATGECQFDPRIYGPAPWICTDQNGDGTIDVGDYELRHYIRYTETSDVYVYPFTAKGAPLPEGFVPPSPYY